MARECFKRLILTFVKISHKQNILFYERPCTWKYTKRFESFPKASRSPKLSLYRCHHFEPFLERGFVLIRKLTQISRGSFQINSKLIDFDQSFLNKSSRVWVDWPWFFRLQRRNGFLISGAFKNYLVHDQIILFIQ